MKYKIKDKQLKEICKVVASFHRWRKLEISTEEKEALESIKEILKKRR